MFQKTLLMGFTLRPVKKLKNKFAMEKTAPLISNEWDVTFFKN